MVEIDDADADVTFSEARHGLLETFAEEGGWTLHDVVREYNNNAEFKRRIDLAALNMSCQTSEAIH